MDLSVFEEVIDPRTDLFQPAPERYLAYIEPMAPMPMRPIVGCCSVGSLGLTLAETIGRTRKAWEVRTMVMRE